jgi:RNA polymerase sigma-70 factor (ECF subfamily)
MTGTPVSLLERLRQPDEGEAWGRFVALYTPLLYSWARRVGLQESDAADLVQEVFTVLVQKLPDFAYDQHRSFRAWLKTLTLNKWREGRRRAGARREQPQGLAEPAAPDQLEAFWETEYHQHLAAHALRIMQADFEPQTWQACWELVVNDRPAAQVARELGLSVGTIYAAKCRVLARLRQELVGLVD